MCVNHVLLCKNLKRLPVEYETTGETASLALYKGLKIPQHLINTLHRVCLMCTKI